MEEDKINEFLSLYEEHKKQRGPVPTSKEDVFIEMIKIFLDSTTLRDKKRTAKTILKSKPSMKDHSLWSFIDEQKLQEVVNT